jgi:hypothetical protein
VCPSVCLSVRSSDILLARRFVQGVISGRKGGEFSFSLINTNEEVSSLSLSHTHSR